MKQTIQFGHTSSAPRIAYAQCGEGPKTIFFLHGIGGNKSNWTEQLQYFGGLGYRAVAWDIRGYGDSEDYDGPFDFELISADLVRLMDELQVSQAHFVGLSMGGRILMDFAYRYAQRVHSLIICAAFPSFGQALSPEQRADYVRLRKQPLLEGRSFTELAPELTRSLLGPNASTEVVQALQASICTLRKDSYLKALEAAVYFDRTQEIQSIRVPTLLLYGEEDRLTPPTMGAQVAALMPQAQMHILPGCGHLMNLEMGAAFNHQVAQFLGHKTPCTSISTD